MPNGDLATEKGTKMTSIQKKIDYLFESCKKNLNLSGEIRSKLLSSEAEKMEETEKAAKCPGQLSHIIDCMQELLNLVNESNSHLISVNKEL